MSFSYSSSHQGGDFAGVPPGYQGLGQAAGEGGAGTAAERTAGEGVAEQLLTVGTAVSSWLFHHV